MRVARRLWPWAGLAVVLAAWAWIQARSFTPGYQELDPDGYMLMARRLAQGRLPIFESNDPFLYHGHVWVTNPRGETVCKYDPGYPLVMAMFRLCLGDEGPFWVSPVLGGLALVGAFLLFRRWMRPLPALLAVLVLGTNTMMLYYCGYVLTHATDLFFVTWGMFFLWGWTQRPSAAWGIAAGLALGCAAAVRHTSALLAPVVAVALLWQVWSGLRARSWAWRPALALAAAYCVVPLALCLYDWRMFGGPFATGYALSGEQQAFGLRYAAGNMAVMNSGLAGADVLFAVLPLGLAAMVLIGPWQRRMMSLLWLAPQYAVYVSYYWASDGPSYWRFMIGVFPLVTGAAFLLLDRLKGGRRVRVGAMMLLVAFALGARWPALARGATVGIYDRDLNRAPAQAGRIMSRELADDAVVFAAQPLQWCAGTRRHFRLYELRAFYRSHIQRPFDQAPTVLRQAARTEKIRAFYQSHTDAELLAMERALVRAFLEQSRQVVFLVPVWQVSRERQRLGAQFEFRTVTEWDAEYMGRWGLYEVKLASRGGGG